MAFERSCALQLSTGMVALLPQVSGALQRCRLISLLLPLHATIDSRPRVVVERIKSGRAEIIGLSPGVIGQTYLRQSGSGAQMTRQQSHTTERHVRCGVTPQVRQSDADVPQIRLQLVGMLPQGRPEIQRESVGPTSAVSFSKTPSRADSGARPS